SPAVGVMVALVAAMACVGPACSTSVVEIAAGTSTGCPAAQPARSSASIAGKQQATAASTPPSRLARLARESPGARQGSDIDGQTAAGDSALTVAMAGRP